MFAAVTQANEWCKVGFTYSKITKKSSKKKRKLLKRCAKVKFANPACNECVRIKKTPCRKLLRNYKRDRTFCQPSKKKSCVKLQKTIDKFTKYLAGIEGGEPAKCKKPSRKRPRTRKQKRAKSAASKAYKTCRTIKSRASKLKKDSSTYTKKCLRFCSVCIEECKTDTMKVFDAQGKCREPSLREKLTKASARPEILRTLK